MRTIFRGKSLARVVSRFVGALVITVIAGLGLGVAPAGAAGEVQASGPKTVDNAAPNPGSVLTYQIPYFCASSIPGDNCNGWTIVDPIPTFTDAFGTVRSYEVVSAPGNSQWSAGVVVAGSPDSVVWTATNLIAGDTGFVACSSGYRSA